MDVVLDVAEAALLGSTAQASRADMAQGTLDHGMGPRQREPGRFVIAVPRRSLRLFVAVARGAIEGERLPHAMRIGMACAALSSDRSELEVERCARGLDRGLGPGELLDRDVERL